MPHRSNRSTMEYDMKRVVVTLLSLVVVGCASVPEEEPPGQPACPSVVICHKGKKTMEVPEEAVEAHLGHGDHLGPC